MALVDDHLQAGTSLHEDNLHLAAVDAFGQSVGCDNHIVVNAVDEILVGLAIRVGTGSCGVVFVGNFDVDALRQFLGLFAAEEGEAGVGPRLMTYL